MTRLMRQRLREIASAETHGQFLWPLCFTRTCDQMETAAEQWQIIFRCEMQITFHSGERFPKTSKAHLFSKLLLFISIYFYLFITFIHYMDLYSAFSRLLLRSAVTTTRNMTLCSDITNRFKHAIVI